MSMEKAEDVLRATGILVSSIQTLQGLTKLGGDKAENSLAVIGAMLDAISDGITGKTTPEVVEAELTAILTAQGARDQVWLAALRAKFAKKDSP